MNYEHEIVRAVDAIIPSVVSVVISKQAHLLEPSLPFKGTKIKDIQEEPIRIGGGSGFIVSEDGLVLTNKHVIAEPDADYTVFDQEGDKIEASILARDPIHDVAILKITPPRKFRVAPLGSAQNLRLGQTVIAIGNALGEFQSSVSTGVVSGLSRLITAVSDFSGHQERLRGLIQTDAAINPGNSGGPLINIQGEVIGINAAVVFGAQNIGFAIPIDKAIRDLSDIHRFGRIRRPFLGIRYLILNPSLERRLRLPVDYGALVVREPIPGDHAVIPGSAAEKAGIKEGDIVLACNGSTVNEKRTLEDILETVMPGDTVNLTILRNGEKHGLKLEIKEWK